jgi:hypothetical protein
LVTNEVFETAKFRFDRIGPDGKPAVVHTIELTNGAIIAVKSATGSGGKRYVDMTLGHHDGLLVNALPDGIIPYSAFGFVER